MRPRGALVAMVVTGLLLAGGAARGVMPAGAAPAADNERQILHVLNRLTYGPRPGDVARVRAVGLEAYIERQLRPETIDDSAVDQALRAVATLRMSTPELLREYPRLDPAGQGQAASGEMTRREQGEMTRREQMDRYPPERRPARIVAELAAAKMVRAVMSERQLQEVMVDFWFNHFNVYAFKGEVRWYVTAYEREAIRPNALGKFRDLVRATAHHPAMLFYLDNWLSVRDGFTIPTGPQKGKRAGLNENYARELMELHTLGVDGGYTQKDVHEVARAFTGWTIDKPRVEGRFVFRRRVHDTGQKMVLGQRIAGGGQDDGERVIEILTRHPATARFIATKLCRRFVSDDPPPALVERVATTYRQTDGDIRAMLKTMFSAPEFGAQAARGAKIKTPFEFVVGSVRALGGSVDAAGGFALARASARIGETLYGAEPPTGYPDRAEPWVNPGALLARMNFGLGLVHNRFPGVRVDLPALVAGADRTRPDVVLDRLVATVLNGEISEATRAVLTGELGDPEITRQTPDDRGLANTDIEKLAALVIGSPEFQRQ